MKYKAIITAILCASVSLHASKTLQKTTGRVLEAVSKLRVALSQEEGARIGVRCTMRSLIPLKKTIAKLEPIPDMSDEIASKKYDLDHYQHKLRRTLPELLSAAQETKAILHEYHDVL